MQYTNFLLLALGLFGIIIHNLIKIETINRNSNGNFKFLPFIKLEWPSIAISVSVVIVAIIVKSEIQKLEAVSNWLGVGFVAIGYMAQSIVYALMGKAQKIIDSENK